MTFNNSGGPGSNVVSIGSNRRRLLYSAAFSVGDNFSGFSFVFEKEFNLLHVVYR